jgi:hypothetical protein
MEVFAQALVGRLSFPFLAWGGPSDREQKGRWQVSRNRWSTIMDVSEKRRESTEPGHAPLDVLRQTRMESQSQPTPEPRHTLVPGESSQTREPSESQPDQSSIHSLAQQFVQWAKGGTKIQGLALTDQQYTEVQEYLAHMKERREIAPDTYTKARKKAYQISDKGRDVIKRYHTSDKGKKTIKRYQTSDKGREANKRYQTSDKRRETRKRYRTSNKDIEAIKHYEISDKDIESRKRYDISDKSREAKKRYQTSDKGRETRKRYDTSDKGRETRKRYDTSKKGRESKKRYNASDKAKEADKRYQTSDKGREAYKRYDTSKKGREAHKRYDTSDKGKETKKRYREQLKDPRQQKARLEHKINRENEEYRQKMQELDQQLQNALASRPLPRPELQHWLAKKQQLEEAWKTLREHHQKALQKADALVECYNELSALVEAFPSPPHQQTLGAMPPEHAWVLEEASHDEAFETSERFQELHNHLRSQLEPSPSVSHPPELRPTEPAATQPSAFESLMTDYDHAYEQLEVYLQEFAAPESWLLRNTLDF